MLDSPFCRVFPGVELGAGVVLEDFCVIGQPPRQGRAGDRAAVIGDGCLIRSHSVIYAGARLGRRVQTGHWVLIREDSVVGDDCSIGTGTVLEFSVTLGRGVRLHSHCFVPEFSVLEDGCWLGPRVVVTNARYPASPRTKESLAPVRIASGARVGANVTLLPGLSLGAGCLVGAGSVVTRDVEPDTLVVGNPARPVGVVSRLRDAQGLVYPSDAHGE